MMCWHRKTSFPHTPKKGEPTYIVCLDCGRHLPYDWEKMGRVKSGWFRKLFGI